MSDIWTMEDEQQFINLTLRRARFNEIRATKLANVLNDMNLPAGQWAPRFVDKAEELYAALEPYLGRKGV